MAKRLDYLGVSAFFESMGMMLQSGIQTDEAVGLLHSESRKTGGILETGLGVMKEKLDAGASLDDAMETSGIFPEYAVQMVKAGGVSGRLENIMFRLSRYYAQQKTISDKIRGAVTYPAAMLVLIIAVLVIMLTMVFPSFTGVYQSLTGSVAASSFNYIRWSYLFCWIVLGIMVLLVAALVTGAILWKCGKKQIVEKVLCVFPICRSIIEGMGMFRFTSALSTFISSGEMQDQAVSQSIEMTDCVPVEKKLHKVLGRMEEGHSISQAAYDEDLFEPVYGRMLLAGERSGNLETVLERLTELLEHNCGNLVDRLVGIVDPLLSGAMMVTVGISLLSAMLPLIGIMNSIG